MSLSWQNILAAVYAANAPVSSSGFGAPVVNDLNYLFANGVNSTEIGADPILPNNSFEADANGTAGASMTAWTWTNGNSIAGNGIVTNTQNQHGAKSFQMIQGTTGGQTAGVLQSAFLTVSPQMAYRMTFQLYCTRADVQNSVVVNWYDQNQNFISTAPAYSLATGSSPTSWTAYPTGDLIPPSNARYAAIILQGGQNSSTPPASQASIYWDGIQFFRRPQLSSITNPIGNSGTWTVPMGTFVISCRLWGKNYGGVIAGYVETGYLFVIPGTVLTITISAGASITINGGTYTAGQSGGASGPGFNFSNGSLWSGPGNSGQIIITY